MLTHAWIIPLIPVVAFVVILFVGRRLPMRGAEVGVTAMALTTLLSLWMATEWITGDRVPVVSRCLWFSYGDIHVSVGTIGDGLTSMMLVVVAVISLLVQIFSVGYMHEDRRFTHYFAILTLFPAAMQWFVMSSSTLAMIFGWELMSLCSFILIGHWWEEKSNVNAAVKAFLTTRASDIGLFVGVIVLFFAAGRSFDIVNLNGMAVRGDISHGLLIAGASALFIAVIGKSAQFPLHTWLPDAMAGPTPVSALIHAATMVVAGVFLLARLFPVFAGAFSISPYGHGGGSAINPIALIGGITIVIAALLAFVQRDIKKVLAYSTVSQLGYMVMAIGVGAWVPAMFHLFTHAFFKALLFLGAGSVSHAVHGFDIEKDMGGLRKKMPITHATFAIGTAALIGIIPLAGFWSKEQIVAQAGANGYAAFATVAIIGTFLTAAYMTRLYGYVFLGEHRGSSVPHESPLGLTVPLVVLAALSATVGFLDAPLLHVHLFESWITPGYVLAHHYESGLSAGVAVEIAAALLGIGLSWVAFVRGFGIRSLAARYKLANAAYVLLHNRYYLDWLYERVIVRSVRLGLASGVRWFDHQVVDGFVNDTAATAPRAGGGLSRLQNGHVQRYASVMLGAVAVVAMILAVQ